MKKHILIITLLFYFSVNVNNGQILESSGLAIKALDVTGLSNALSSMGNKLLGGITGGGISSSDVTEYKKLYTLLRNSICVLKKNEFLIRIYGGNNDCFFNVQKEATLLKYSQAAKGIEVAIASVSVVTKLLGGEKSSSPSVSVKDLNTQIEAAIKDLNELNKMMQYDISTAVFKALNNHNIKSGQEVSQEMKGV